MNATPSARSPWTWVPSLYFGQGIPFVVAMTLSVVMYKNLGIGNDDIALYTSWLYLPWVIKPLWSPLVDLFGTKRGWIVLLQFVMGAALAAVALTLPMPAFFQLTLAVFWLMAFASATHDIAADGFYMLALPQHLQAAFVGVRSTFYRAAMITGQGALVWLAGEFTEQTGNVKLAWTLVFSCLAVLFLLLAVWHRFALPRPAADATHTGGSYQNVMKAFFGTFAAFFSRRDLWLILAFLLTFRLGEAQALKLITPFMLDPAAKGGLGLTTKDVGLIYGTLGVAALTVGGLLGGFAISRLGLARMLWPMLLAVHIPNLLFIYLAATQPQSQLIIAAVIIVEQFGYGFGFASYLMFMILVAAGVSARGGSALPHGIGANPHQTAHYSICTGFMALGMMIPGMWSGKLQVAVGYPQFFVWVCICTLPSLCFAYFLRIDPHFGRQRPDEAGPV
jgi:MFS transporter, PAT family, beta-lactamase induction signal transducer AmpG